jgi:hypothetical protein
MNTFDWVKKNTSFQFYSKETLLEGMARFDASKREVVYLENLFFLSPSLSICSSPRAWSVVRVDFAEEYIYIYIYTHIYNRLKIRRDMAWRRGESGGMRGRSEDFS